MIGITEELKESLLKGLRGLHDTTLFMELSKKLLAAPTVRPLELDKLERWDPIIEDGNATYDKHETGSLVLFSDLQSLVVPEQSGNPSRETLRTAMRACFEHMHPVGPTIGDGWIEDYLNKLQPAPMPSVPTVEEMLAVFTNALIKSKWNMDNSRAWIEGLAEIHELLTTRANSQETPK